MITEEMRPAIGFAGAGRAAMALARLLLSAGEPVRAIASRSPRRAHAAAEALGHGVSALTYAQLAHRAERFLIAVPDRAIASVAAELAAHQPRGIALHTCGAAGPEALSPLARAGVACGCLHPLQTLAPDSGPETLRGVTFSIAGDPAAMAWAEHIASLAGGSTLHLPSHARAAYHAAAVMAGNYLTALIDAAAETIALAGVGRDRALAALGPLIRTSVENTLALGPAAALTGPIQRGDAETVAAHLAALQNAPKTVRNLYCAAGLHTLAIARNQGLDPEAAAAVQYQLNRK